MTKAGKFWLLVLVMGVLGLVEAVTGFVLWLAFPEGGGGAGRLSGGISNLTVLGITKHVWVSIHDWVAVALVVVVLVHVIVHWKWMIRVGKQVFRTKPAPVTEINTN